MGSRTKVNKTSAGSRVRDTLRRVKGGLSVNVDGARVMFTEDDAPSVTKSLVEQSYLRSSQTQTDLWDG